MQCPSTLPNTATSSRTWAPRRSHSPPSTRCRSGSRRRSCASGGRAEVPDLSGATRLRGRSRQTEREHGAATIPGMGLDESAMLLDDPVRYVEPKAEALVMLGVSPPAERLEQP